ncbi:hypothetical protein [Aneurinibacillus aneurinilyticus]|jgi:hypothetical protein|uniref:Phr family secreted Rap phosphatase inhibitor n=2 Tax=Aneurinibacillus aneurinilyticus TaxID=1391 RepID=A0A848CS20_ANEAE|nr:hypothetical protein [Aneurinibacillus aneurinilyticus]ERI11785.1 hypothetical protein HMPREF0083_00113 [Aneurinibacillus aneurinilyticus ATCC 12856]MCI1694904.1 hypothetical protein [Aneurinibacillus aneurinilyticus]MED0673602.1 hypothetical protein [Aneurinibacillus aneurinilyticus]MED0706594.1 hypothetical protein [Aneurinibacillus aneurinilyticus]MED0725589.1 hypothetical protein [Aneurinibacillus aneurinilyticus]
MIKKSKLLLGLLVLAAAFGITEPYSKDTTNFKDKAPITTFAHHGG